LVPIKCMARMVSRCGLDMGSMALARMVIDHN